MTTEPELGRLNDGLTVLRRVRDYEVLVDEDGNRRPSSQAFIQGGPDGDVSVYLASETTPERITRDYPDTYVAEVDIKTIRDHGLNVERDPIENDPGHCNITGRKSRSRTRAIARHSRWTTGFGPTEPGRQS